MSSVGKEKNLNEALNAFDAELTECMIKLAVRV